MVSHLRRLGLWKQKSYLMEVDCLQYQYYKELYLYTFDCFDSVTLINGAYLCVVSVNWQVCTVRVSSRGV